MRKLRTSHLGLLLGASFNAQAIGQVVEERFIRKLAMWKR